MTFTEGWRASCFKAVLGKYLKACCTLVLKRSSASPSGCNMIWPTSYRKKSHLSAIATGTAGTCRTLHEDEGGSGIVLEQQNCRLQPNKYQCHWNSQVSRTCKGDQHGCALGPRMPSSSRGQRAARPPLAHFAPDTYGGGVFLKNHRAALAGHVTWLAREQPVDMSILLTARKRFVIHVSQRRLVFSIS